MSAYVKPAKRSKRPIAPKVPTQQKILYGRLAKGSFELLDEAYRDKLQFRPGESVPQLAEPQE